MEPEEIPDDEETHQLTYILDQKDIIIKGWIDIVIVCVWLILKGKFWDQENVQIFWLQFNMQLFLPQLKLVVYWGLHKKVSVWRIFCFKIQCNY
jgi:hypothetical protein